MKSPLRFLCAAAVAPALLLSSCVAPYYGGPNEAAGSVAGALIGAAAGGIIGHQSCYGLEGALIGGALGSAIGASAGASQDRYYYGPPAAVMPAYGYGYAPVPPPVVVAPSIGFYSGGYYGGRRCYPHRSHCW
jgi:phage tail tape-measure protein